MKNVLRYFVLFAVCAACAAVSAQDEGRTLQDILDQQEEIAQAIEDGEYAHLPAASISAIKRSQRVIRNVTSGRSELSQLPPQDQVHLANALQTVKAKLDGSRQARDEQEVCWRERKTGSKISETVCGTEAERDFARAGARGFMERPRNCTPPDCGGSK